MRVDSFRDLSDDCVARTAVDTLVANNTVYGNDTFGIDVSGASAGSVNARVVNNLVWGNRSSQITNSATNTQFQTNTTVDPQVVDADRGNFRLGPGSPATDTGAEVSEVTHDIAGVPRPQGRTHDRGAYELITPPSAPQMFEVQ